MSEDWKTKHSINITFSGATECWLNIIWKNNYNIEMAWNFVKPTSDLDLAPKNQGSGLSGLAMQKNGRNTIPRNLIHSYDFLYTFKQIF